VGFLDEKRGTPLVGRDQLVYAMSRLGCRQPELQNRSIDKMLELGWLEQVRTSDGIFFQRTPAGAAAAKALGPPDPRRN
jgi:hypothetical protein